MADTPEDPEMAAPLASTDAEPAALQSTDLETVPELEQVPTDEPAPPSTNPEIAAPPPDQTTSRPRTPPAKTPRQSGEGIEKTDWEVVNASPSHSPSKDADNQGAQKGKTKQRERETSGSSTGKIGQKIDGVKKVLKSGVFGGSSSPRSAPTATTGRATKTITKPPVPSARPATKPAAPTTTATRPRAGSVGTLKPTVPAAKPATTATRTTAGAAATKTGTTASRSVAATTKPATTTRQAKADSASTVPTATTLSRRGSVASPPSTTRGEPTSGSTKSRASLPIAARMASKTSTPASTVAGTAGRPPANRPSTAPAVVVKKEVDDLKAKVEDLEKQLATDREAHETRVGELVTEGNDRKTSYAAASDELASAYDAAVERVKEHVAREHDEEQIGNEGFVVPKLEAQLEEHGKLVASLNNQLATTLDLGTSHKAQISQAKEGQIQFQRKIDKLQMGISALEDQLADCQRVLSNKQKEISAVQNELEENRDAYEATQAEIVSLHARIANLETEVAQRDEADKGRAELQKQIDELLDKLEESKSQLAESRERLEDSLKRSDNLTAVSQTHLASIKQAEEDCEKQGVLIAQLSAQIEEDQRKHEGLLHEAAQISNTRIIELSEEVDKVNSLRNELAAELEQERSTSHALRDEAAKSKSELEAAVLHMKLAESELERLQAEMVEVKAEHERKYASAFEEATKVATAEHAKDVELLQGELATTHKRISKEHESQMQRIESKHLTSIADLREEHQRTVSQLMEKVLTTEALLAGAQSETAVAATKLEKAEADAKRVKAELEAAVAKSSADASAKEDLAKALRHNAELIEELDSVKSMADMNKSQFEALQQSAEDDHASALQSNLAKSEKELEDAKEAHQRMVQGLRDEIRQHRDELERERTAVRDLKTYNERLQNDLKAAKKPATPVSQPSAPHHPAGSDDDVDSLLLSHGDSPVAPAALSSTAAEVEEADEATIQKPRTLSERILAPVEPSEQPESDRDSSGEEVPRPHANVRDFAIAPIRHSQEVPSSPESTDAAGPSHLGSVPITPGTKGERWKGKGQDNEPHRYASKTPPAGFNGTSASLPPNPFWSDSSENESSESTPATHGSPSDHASPSSSESELPYRRRDQGSPEENDDEDEGAGDSSGFDMSGDIEIDPTEVTPNASTFQVDLPHITESSPAAASNADPSSPAPTPTKDVL